MKTLILGDIHGRLTWEDIINKEQPDLTTFLGDYVSTHELIPADQQLSNLEDILNYKAANPDKVILLRGNHDIQHLGYYWAECSGFDPTVYKHMSSSEFRERFLSLTQWIHVDEENKTIYAHAGVSEVWISETIEPYLVEGNVGPQYDDGSIDVEIILKLINTIEPCEVFGFIPNRISDYCGTSTSQSCVWIRPETLAKCMVEEYTQVVGHTPVKRDCVDLHQITKNHQHLWCCDALQQHKYLVIEDGEFKPKGLYD